MAGGDGLILTQNQESEPVFFVLFSSSFNKTEVQFCQR